MTADELSEEGLAERMRPYVIDRDSWGGGKLGALRPAR